MKTIALFVGLILYVQSVPHLNAAVLIATNTTWRYLDNGTDQGAAWRSMAYDDSAWAAGPAELGYGELDEATVVGGVGNITTYFRRAFNVSSPSSFASLTIRLERDDGAVVYLNGTEVFRDNMPTGAVTYATLASSGTEGNFFVTTNVSNTLNSGQNVIAVEIHQQVASSSDLSFSLELIGEEPQPLVMRILGFDGAGAHLAVEGTPGGAVTIQSSADTINWQDLVSGTIGPSGVLLHTNAFAGASRAYRASGDSGVFYSVNIVAVYQLSIAPGYAMIGNHLFDTTNTVAALLPSPPPGTSIYKIGSDNRFAVNNYLQGWSDTAMMLRPGDGVFIRNPTASAMSVAFKGELPQGTLVNQLPAGFTICSSIVPQSGPLQSLLQFPAEDDDAIYVLNPGMGYNIYSYFSGEWGPEEPVIGVGQAFWSLKGAAANWSRNFSVSGGGGNYTATQFAATSSVAQVNFLTYNTNTNKGRVFLPGGLAPVSSNFFGQLYAGTAASEASLVAIGTPTQFLGDAGYIRGGTVVVPSASPNESRFFQLRAWDIASGANYEAALANGGTRGKSAIFSAVVGGGLQTPPDVNDFASFAVTGNAPAITTQPQSQTVVAGSNATFSVTASGAPPFGYQWFFNGVAIASATSATLALNNVQAANAGNYHVVVDNASGSVTSSVATLTLTQRGLIAAESFVYPVGSIVGLNGGVGFRGAYTGGGSVTSNSLAYTDTNGAALPTTGGRYLAMPNPYQPTLRDLDTNGQPGAKFGAPGSIIYVGFLVRLDSGTNAGLGWGGVSLVDGAIERVFFGDPGFEGQLNWGVDRQLGSNNVRLSSVPVDSSTHLLVGRIDFGVEDATVRLYVDPPLNQEPSTASVLPFAGPPFRFTAVRIASSPNVFSFDEIKVGTSYDDVVQAVSGVGSCLPAPPGLVSWWRGEGDALDAAGGNHGSLSNGTTFAAGRVGQAFSLDGVNDFISFGDQVGNFGTNDFSIEFWMKTSSTAYAGILSKRPICNNASTLDVRLWSDGRLLVEVDEYGNPQLWNQFLSSQPVNDNLFHHLALVRERTNVLLYVDGVLDTRNSTVGVASIVNTAQFVVGKSICTGVDETGYFLGALDELSLYSRALSSNEIAAIYAAGSTGKCPPAPCVTPPPGLIAWYPMDGSANDLSGRGNNGVVHGAAPTANRFGVPNSAYSFNGTDNFIEVPDNGSFNFTYPVSLVAWVNPLDASKGGIVGQWGYGGGPDAYLLSLSSNRVTGTLPRAGLFQTTSSGTLPLSNWTHVGMTFDGATVRYFINGAASGTFAAPPITNHNINEPVIIGLENIFFDNLNYFRGSLDDVLIFNRVISSNEIAAIYSAGSAGMCPPRSLQLAVQGSGNIIVNPQSQTYPFGSTVMISAVPDRYHTFLHWSDGNTNSLRTITVGLDNNYTAIFTNNVPLETLVFKQWERTFGGTFDDELLSVQQTSDGGYILGGYSDSLPSGNKGATNFGLWDCWVVKLDASGNKQWEKTFGGSGNDICNSAQQTADGGYILGGQSCSNPGGTKTSTNYGQCDFWIIKLDASGNQEWERTFGGSSFEDALAVEQTADGGYILGGTALSDASGNKISPSFGSWDYWLVKVDANGSKQWEGAYGGNQEDDLLSLQQTLDGGYILGGRSSSGVNGNKTTPNFGQSDYWVIKVDANGSKQWEQNFGGSDNDELRSVRQAANRGYVLGGVSGSSTTGNKLTPNAGNWDFWLIKLDTSGGREWEQSFGGSDLDWMFSVWPTSSGYLLGGSSASGMSDAKTSPNYGGLDYWLVKVDSTGLKKWERSFGGSADDWLHAAVQTESGEIVLAGSSASGIGGNKTTAGFGSNDFWVVKLFEREAPVGTPVILVDGRIDPSNTVSVTNAALLEIQSSFPGAHIFFTLDGSDPDQGEIYTGPLVITSDAIVRAVAYTANFQTSAEADPVIILVAQAPVIVVGPQSQVVAAGVTVQFGVVASGEEPLHYQWFKGEAELPGQTNSALFIFGAQTSDAGLYSVAVANAHGLVHSGDAALGIIEPPVITIQPAAFSVMPGVDVDITNCVLATGGEPLRYQWRKNGANLRGETNRCIIILNVQVEDGGTYEVIVANAVSAVVSTQALLRVVLPVFAAGNDFAQRTSLGAIGSLQADNINADKEPGEPNHGGKPGGSSVWYRWTAPFNGIATFATVGSSFDTLLAVYTGLNVSNLTVVASDEDSGGFLTSLVRFSAVAGREYAIAVDGFGNTQGEYSLSWNIVQSDTPLPVILQQPLSQTALLGTNVSFTVGASNAASFLWFRNGVALYAETGSQLMIPVARPEDVGDYRVVVANSMGEGIQSEIAVLEIARGVRPPGARSADKIEDLTFPVSPSGGGLRAGKTPEVVTPVRAGLTDLQILNNSGSSTSIGESNACGVIGDASRWFQVRAFSNATMRVDTIGSSIDTILSVYIGTNQLTAGFRLVPGGCDDDSGPNGTSIVRFPATNGVDYSIQIGGKNGTNGIVFLNFGLGFAPSNSQAASRLVARQGDNITLNCTAAGTPDPMFFWYRSNQTASATFVAATATGSLPLLNLQPDKQGTYTVIVSNFIASITNTIAEVVVQTNALIAAQTGFDSTMEGWTAMTNGGALDLRHSGAGGNPGGHLAVRIIPTAGYWYWVAPAAYLGNKFYCYNGSLSFELRQTITDSLAALPAEDVILEGAGQRLVINLSNPTASIWTTYRVSLNESPSVGWRLGSLAGPTVTREQFLAVLTSLTNLMIRGAAGSELGHIDSVLLLGSTTPALSIRADGSDWLIEWPQALAGFSLQTVTAFQPTAASPQVDQWIATTQPPTLTNSLNSVRVPGLPTQQFFRLRKPAQ